MTGRNADFDTSEGSAFDVWEPHIRSFVSLCSDTALSPPGGLGDLTVGIKDIIDVEGIPTRNGSAASADARPAVNDAAVVAALRAAGARIVGKTATTEFAFTDPTDCRNPYDLTRSPGGSSSGSGAAVAAGLVDLALGTQTAGSLCRPAAYCGVVGLKPTFGALSTEGVTSLARSFDTVGVIARSVDVAQRAFKVLAGDVGLSARQPLKVAAWLLPGDVQPTADMQDALDNAAQALANCAAVKGAVSPPCETSAIVSAHRTVMLAEAAEAHGAFLASERAERLRPKFREALVAGTKLGAHEVDTARKTLFAAREAFWRALAEIDVILTLPVPEGAPHLDGSTGFQDWLTPWTVFGGPLVSLPWGLDRVGRPRAVMLAGKPGADLSLLGLAHLLEQVAPELPAPVPPPA